jgi:hypothetical protein
VFLILNIISGSRIFYLDIKDDDHKGHHDHSHDYYMT